MVTISMVPPAVAGFEVCLIIDKPNSNKNFNAGYLFRRIRTNRSISLCRRHPSRGYPPGWVHRGFPVVAVGEDGAAEAPSGTRRLSSVI